ncbi:MAG TPA: hypothetical protein VKZ53_13090 [Candidatus Angelobacter sp.]|nr:hypothetical protein [Candidatus Angelobacter sp.]
MTRKISIVLVVVGAALLGLMTAPSTHVIAQQVGEQNLLKLRFVSAGASAQGSNILQTGELSNVSPAVATSTLTRVIAAPSTSQTYIRSVLVEKSTGSSGSFTIQFGTGTNCATGTTVVLGPVVNPPIQTYYLGAQVPPGQDVCVQTDASTTSVRLLFN